MKLVQLTSVPDHGAAQVAEELLRAEGVDCELMRSSNLPLFAAVSSEQWIIRVPEEQLEQAQKILKLLEAQSEEALAAEAMAAGRPSRNMAAAEQGKKATEAAEDSATLLSPKRVRAGFIIALLLTLLALGYISTFFIMQRTN